jgi:hypothetical protein
MEMHGKKTIMKIPLVKGEKKEIHSFQKILDSGYVQMTLGVCAFPNIAHLIKSPKIFSFEKTICTRTEACRLANQ